MDRRGQLVERPEKKKGKRRSNVDRIIESETSGSVTDQLQFEIRVCNTSSVFPLRCLPPSNTLVVSQTVLLTVNCACNTASVDSPEKRIHSVLEGRLGRFYAVA